MCILCCNLSFLESIDQTYGQVEHQLLVGQLRIFIDAVEALSLELVAACQVDAFKDVKVDLNAS